MIKFSSHPYWIAVVFFFVGFTPGIWMPSLPNVLNDMGYKDWIPWVYGGSPVGAIISPFLLGALSDGKIAANRLCGYVMLAGGVTMTTAFWMLHRGAPIELFVILMFVNSLLNAPIWALVTQSALSYLSGNESKFPFYRFWGAAGWLAAGVVGGLVLQADESSFAGVVAGICRFPAGLFCFLMPHCEPLARKARFSILQMMGEGGRDLWTDRNTRVLLVSAGLIAIPLSSFFMYCPLLMKSIGVEKPTAWLTMALWFELPAMLTLSWACLRFRMKWLMGIGLGVVALRQALFALSAEMGVFYPLGLGLLTHGLTFAYFMTVAQMYMEKRVASELRGRAQGMLSLMFGGVGSLIGVTLNAQIFKRVVDVEAQTGWTLYWGILAVFAAIPTVYFLMRYQKGQSGGNTVDKR